MQTVFKTWILPILALILLNVIYFYPALTGKVLSQDDEMLGLAKRHEISEYREAHGEEPLWTNAMFSGMPTFQITTNYPNNGITYLKQVISLLGKPSRIYIFASMMIMFFIMLRALSVRPWIAVAGSLAFAFSAFFVISFAAGHIAKVHAAAYIAPLVAGVILTLRGKWKLGLILTLIGAGLSIQTNHFQITYYSAFILAAIVITEGVYAVKNGVIGTFAKRLGLVMIAGLIAIGPNIGNLWSTYTYTQESMRGGHSALNENSGDSEAKGLDFEYAMSWSYSPLETMGLFIPNIMGGGAKQSYEGTDTYDFLYRNFSQQARGDQAVEMSNRYAGSVMYWGEQSLVNGAYYVGAVLFFLIVFGFQAMEDRLKWALLGVTVISVFMAWGHHFESFNRILFNHLPLYDKFRVPSMALLIVFFTIPLVASLGLERLFSGKLSSEQSTKLLKRSLYITGGIALFFAVIGPAFFSFEGANDGRFAQQLDMSKVIGDRQALMRSSAITSLFFIAATFAALWFYVKGSLKPTYALLAIVALVVVDLWKFDKDQLGKEEWLPEREFAQTFAPSAADQMILKDKDIHYRVFNTTAGLTSDSYTSYYHKSIGGYHGAKLARYQDLIDEQLSKGNISCFNMLNAKWFIQENGQNGKVAVPNPNACGNAWFPSSVTFVDNTVEEMRAMDEFNPQVEVIAQSSLQENIDGFVFAPDSTVNRSIVLESYDPKHMVYKSQNSGGDALAVFSEIYYTPTNQAWQAYVDGEAVDHYRVNYLLRSMVVPSGNHTIEFVFEPKTYYAGEKIDLGMSILFYGIIALLGFMIYRDSKSKTESSEA
ncbi:MAG: hypothetical protein EP346_08285 [Bacteroidetes bacterium]|nr:MAG: hypothetical protein EP346_08285 [Bacteroidota bacterium]